MCTTKNCLYKLKTIKSRPNHDTPSNVVDNVKIYQKPLNTVMTGGDGLGG